MKLSKIEAKGSSVVALFGTQFDFKTIRLTRSQICNIMRSESNGNSYRNKIMDNTECCPICISDINYLESIYETQCHHKFHRKCFDNYILSSIVRLSSITCPCCRQLLMDKSLISKSFLVDSK